MLHRASLFVLAVLLAAAPVARAQTVTFSELRAEKESAVKQFARSIRSRFDLDNWCTSGDVCNDSDCAIHDCSGSIGEEAECQYDIIAHCDCEDDNKYENEQCPVTDLNDQLCAAFDSPLGASGLPPNASAESSNSTGLHKGQLLNYERPTFRTPANTLSSDGEGHPIVVKDTLMRRDLCSLKQEAKEQRKQYVDNGLTAWFYVGTEYGTFMSFPGHSACRDPEDQDEDQQVDRLLNCNKKDYDPRERPWYITAATGDRDIVFLYDRNLAGSSKLGLAFKEALGTTDERDAVSVRAFDESDRTTNWLRDADTDEDDYTLRKANSLVKNRVFEKLPATGISRASNLRTALGDAFRTLRESNETTSCSRFIVVMLGSDDACFSSCPDSSTAPCTCVRDMLRHVEREQRRFKDGNRATLVTFTEQADKMNARAAAYMEGLASSLACSSPAGMWHGVTARDTPTTAMNAFTQVSSLLLFDDSNETPNIYGTDVYVDSSGLGSMITLSSPVYDFNGRRLVAVVGVDILLSEVLDRTGLSESDARADILKYSRESRTCSRDDSLDRCDAQALRFNRDSSNVCVAPRTVDAGDRSSANATCYEYGARYYTVSSDDGTAGTGAVLAPATFDAAQQLCKDRGGSLAIVGDMDENRALTELVAADGSWLGLRGVNGVWQWVNGSDAVLHGKEFAVHKAGSDQVTDSHCVTADRRGVSHNWVVESCSATRPFVCEFADATNCSASFPTLSDATESEQIPIVPIAAAQCPDLDRVAKRICANFSADAIAGADPLCNQTGADYSDADRRCCGGRGDPAVNKKGAGDGAGAASNSTATIAGAVAGAAAFVFITACVVFVVLMRRRRRKDGSADPSKQKEKQMGNNGGGDGDRALHVVSPAGPAAAQDRHSPGLDGNNDQPVKAGGNATEDESSSVPTHPGVPEAVQTSGMTRLPHRMSHDTNPTTDFNV